MQTSCAKFLTMLTLCSAATLGACATDDANTSDDDAANTTLTSDPLTGEDQFVIAMPDGITVNLSVRQWQTDMNWWINFFGLCGPDLAVDGSFGSKTTTATKCFQRDNSLAQDGDVGPRTLGAMCSLLSEHNQTGLVSASHCN